MKIIGIIGAMEEEIAVFRPKMKSVTVKTTAGMEFISGELFGRSVVLVRCGIGKVNAALCVQALYDIYNVDFVINTGVAGALDPELGICDVVISKDLVQHDFDATKFGYASGEVPRLGIRFFPADTGLVNLALKACAEKAAGRKAKSGRIASGDLFVSKKKDKDRILNDFGASCVEMEGAAIGHACYLNNIPFVVIRAISDTAAEEAGQEFAKNVKIAALQSCDIVEAMLGDIT